MPIVEPDFSEAFKPLVAGIFPCKIVSCDFKISQQGNRYINWRLETLQEKQTVYYSTPIEGKGAGMFKHLVKCAVDSKYEEGRYDTDQLIGKVVIMHLDLKEVESKGKLIKVFEVKEIERAPDGFSEGDDIPW